MKTLKTILFLCIITCGAFAQYNTKNLSVPDATIAEKFTYKNLRFYPIIANEEFVRIQNNTGKYTSLADALKNKKVVITERAVPQRGENGGGESVNNLYIQNNSNDTVLILGGEVIKGGKQDRMIANDMLIPPKSKKIDLSVFCVEHGRWSYHGDGNKGANSYEFDKTYTISSNSVRKAGAVSKNQTEVWDEVAEVTSKNNSKTNSGTYVALDSNADYKKVIAGYQTFFKSILNRHSNAIGFVAVTGNRVMGCDMFATHALLMQHADNLINSYATDANTNGAAVTINYEKVKQYTDKILKDESKQEEMIKQNGSLVKDKEKKLHISVY